MNVPLFWSDKYCELNEQQKLVSKHESGAESFNFEFIYGVHDNLIKSPGKATFGGIWVSEGRPSVAFFASLYKSIFKQFDSLTQSIVSLPPAYFCSYMFQNQSIALEALQFIKSYSDTNFHIEIESWSPASMSKGNRKKIRQFVDAGGKVTLGTPSEYLSAYDVLKGNRENRGVNMSMNFEKFRMNLVEMPQTYSIYLAKLGTEIAGVAYIVRISQNVKYVLFWGDDIKFRNLSPVASLLNFLVPLTQLEGCTILDLGISSVDGTLDTGLARFKFNLGAIESPKPTYSKIPLN